MKNFTLCLLALLWLAPQVQAAPPQVKISAQFVEWNSGKAVPGDVQKIVKCAKANVMKLPATTTRSGRTAEVSLGKTCKAKDGWSSCVSLKTSILPVVSGSNEVRYTVSAEVTHYSGCSPKGPVCSVTRCGPVKGMTAYGQTVVVRLGNCQGRQVMKKCGQPNKTEPYAKELLLLLKFTR